jgi:cysteinyl-tRNA synthetase
MLIACIIKNFFIIALSIYKDCKDFFELVKEKDHLFINTETKTIYYAEIKSNLNLDTEKSKSTTNKCIAIVDELQQKYPDYTIKMFLVGTRYFTRGDFPNPIVKKYKNIQNNLVGINDYLHELGIDNVFCNQPNYVKFLNSVVDAMFCGDSAAVV